MYYKLNLFHGPESGKYEHKTDQTTIGIPSFSVSMLLVVLSLLSFLSLICEAAPQYRYHFCSNETTFKPNSNYQSNLNHLLSSLTSNATRQSGYYTATAGQSPDTTVYGLFLCRGDVSTDSCQTCVATATKEIVEQYCPVGKVAVIWYDECMLRYSNQSFFSTMDEAPSISLYNIQNITEPGRFTELLATAMNDIASRAPNAPSGAKKFATKEAKFTDLLTLYTLVQCIPVLSTSDCNRCLRIVIGTLPSCCNGKQGANVLNPSCNVRYEVYPFYQVQAVPPPPTPVLLAPPPAPAPGNVPRQKVIYLVWPPLFNLG